MRLTRRDALIMAAAATAAGLTGLPSVVLAEDGDYIDVLRLMNPAGIPDKPLGNPDAKVTVIEYVSPTCSHCAAFSNNVLPAFKEKYVDTGKVKLLLRPFQRNGVDLIVFLLAEYAANAASEATTADPSAPSNESSVEPMAPDPANPAGFSQAAAEAYESVLTAFFRTQPVWMSEADPVLGIKKIAVQLGFSDAAFEAALSQKPLFEAVKSMQLQAVNDFRLTGTPTFYINGKQLSGEKSLEELSAEIDPLLG